MKVVGIIPARYGSSRFPGKPLAEICGKPMIQWVYERVDKAKEISNLYVATDDERIHKRVETFGGKSVMTSPQHSCGTDRLAECAEILGLSDEDIVLNIQGDEPLIRNEMISDLLKAFQDKTVYMSTLKKRINDDVELSNPNVVKVVTDCSGNALYFSRYALPYERNEESAVHYKHIGLYGYKKSFLELLSRLEKTPLELTESLEQLRVLEHGYKLRVIETNYQTIGVDIPEQIKQVEALIKKENIANE